jgi:RHS repeat-associated protein
VNDGVRNIFGVSYDGSGRPQVLKNANDLDGTMIPAYNNGHDLRLAYDSTNRVASVSAENVSTQSPTTSTWTFAYTLANTTTDATAATHGTLAAGSTRTAAGYTTITPPCEQSSTTCTGFNGTSRVTVYWDDFAHEMERVELPGTDGTAHHTLLSYDGGGREQWSEDEAGNPTDYSYDPVDNTLTTMTRPDPDGAGPLPKPVTSYSYDEAAYGSVTGSTYAPGTPQQGVQAAYYTTTTFFHDLGGGKYSGRPDTIESAVASGSFSLAAGTTEIGSATNYSARFTGDFVVPTGVTPTLEFQTNAVGAVRMTFDASMLIDQLTATGSNTFTSTSFTTTAGKHPFVLEYIENGSAPASTLTVSYKCDANCGSLPTTFTAVPASKLLPAWNKPTATASPTGRVSFLHYAKPWTGNPDYQLTSAPVNGAATSLITNYRYDTLGRLTGKVLPNGNSGSPASDGSYTGADPTTSSFGTTYSYYAAGHTEATPPSCSINGTYNQLELPASTTPHGLATTQIVYNAAGEPASVTRHAGQTINCYDSENRLASTQAAGDSNSTTYSYDAVGELLQSAHSGTSDDTAGTVTTSYDEAGRLKASTDANGGFVSLLYNADGDLTSRTTTPISGGSNYTTSYSYNDADQLKNETDSASRSYSFVYDARGNLRGTQYPDGTFSWTDYNADGWKTDQFSRHGTITPTTTTAPADPSPINDETFTYNLEGQRTGDNSSAYRTSVTAPSPLLYWRLNEASGTSAADSSGSGRGGTYAATGVTLAASGAISNDHDPAVILATTGYVERTSPGSALNIGSGSFTVDAWAKSSNTAAAAQMIYARYECGWNNCVATDGDANANFELSLSATGAPSVSVRSDNGNSAAVTGSGGDRRDGKWHHYVAVLDRSASLLRLYVDGTQVGSTSISTINSIDDGGSPIEIGREYIAIWNSPNSYFNGSIDDVAIYGSALSAAQIANQTGAATDPATTYTYDSIGRLETATYSDGSSHRYCYDADSNRTKTISTAAGTCSSGTSSSTYTYTSGTNTPADALTAQTGPTRSFTYDGAGTTGGDGMITAIGSDTYRYDGLQRLKSTTTSGKSACYRYGPDGSLTRRIYDSAGTATCATASNTTNYILDDLYEANASGTITTSYVDGPQGDLASFNGPPSTGSTVTYLHYNAHGDLAAETNGSGSLSASHSYDAFGVPLDTPPANATAHRFTGAWSKQYDSTNNLILMGARPYDPTLGRFYEVDPVDGGSLNNYDYAGQDPVNGYDLTGTRKDDAYGGEEGEVGDIEAQEARDKVIAEEGTSGQAQRLPAPSEINAGNLRPVRPEDLEEWTGQTAHQIKAEYLGQRARLSHFDVKYDPENNVFVIVEHQSQRIVEVTYYRRW